MTRGPHLRALRAHDNRSLAELLDAHPERDVYLRSLVWRLGVRLPAEAGQLMGWFDGQRLTGAFLHSQVAVLACEDASGVQAFAEFAAACDDLVPLGQIVSPRSMTEPFLRRLDEAPAPPRLRLLRSDLLAMRVDRGRLAAAPPGRPEAEVALRQASPTEISMASSAARAVVLEELGFDTDEGDEVLFAAAMERRVQAGREYVWVEDGRLLFRAAIAAATPQAVLVEGVWVPPDARGEGRGTRAMGALCDRLLRWHRRVVLFVSHDNVPARRVYEHIGFEQFDHFQAAYFQPRQDAFGAGG